MAMPRPVPSNCIDTTPPELWDILWAIDPEGTMPMPSRVYKNGRHIQFWIGQDADDSAARADLPQRFWTAYWQRFPSGHPSDPTPRVFVDREEWDPSKDGYYLVGGRLEFRHKAARARATGVDAFGCFGASS